MTIVAPIANLDASQRNHNLVRWWMALPLFLLLAWLPTAGAAAAKKKKDPSPGKPALTRAEPRGLQRGVPARIKLTGTNLAEVTALKLHSPKLTGELAKDTKPGAKEIWITLTAAADTPRDGYEISLVSKLGESNRLKLYVDDLPQISESARQGPGKEPTQLGIPAAYWGTIETAGDEDQIQFDARSGQTIVFELAAKSIGSKAASLVLTLVDAQGRTLASNGGFEDGGDPLLAYRFRAKGRYGVRVSDQMLSGSLDHFYRLTVGAFPYVTGIFPLSVATNTTTDVALLGYNLPRRSTVQLTADKGGEMVLPIDTELFRLRRVFKVLTDGVTEIVEREPNDLPRQATRIPVPGSAGGRIWTDGKRQAADTDLFLFEAKAGQQLIIETSAARRGSPLDTRLEVLHADGTPVQRLVLQAVRDSQINFRSIDSVTLDARVDNWREMELNQFLYLQGEVCRIFRMPQGPDSGFQFYRSNGKRRAYFETTPTAHALDEPCYIVEPHPPGAKLVSNGLPVFPLYYGNDDDGDRLLGADSRVHFTAPADGSYLVRVSDTRGFQGELYAYRLRIHEAQPDFKVTLTGTNPTVGQGSGESFNVKAERIDGFDGDIQVDIAGVPPGFTITTPLVIQAGHSEADGSLFAGLDAVVPAPDVARSIRVTAAAMIGGKRAVKMVNNFGEIKLGPKPKLLIALEPDAPASGAAVARPSADGPWEIVIAPGQTVPAWLRVVRNGETNLVNLDVDNLPHGVIIDNIGLNGVQVRAGENEREIFLHAAKWVPETERLCHAILNSARAGSAAVGKQTSLPVLLKVRKPVPHVVAKER